MNIEYFPKEFRLVYTYTVTNKTQKLKELVKE